MSLTDTFSHGWTSRRYAWFRFVLGAYLAIHFAQLVPWAAEVFSSAGNLPDASASPLAGIFPNVLVWFDTPAFVTAFVAAGAVAAIAFALGVRDRILAVVLWYVWACLLGRNPLISNPGIPFVGWLLVFHALVPRRDDGSYDVTSGLWMVAWLVMGVGYTYGGWTKLGSPSWIDGTALLHVLESPLARDTALRTVLVSLPDVFWKIATWSTLALELFAAPLVLWRRARPWLWLALIAMHAGILLTVDFADLTIGMLMIHVLTFDPDWLPDWPGPTTPAEPRRC